MMRRSLLLICLLTSSTGFQPVLATELEPLSPVVAVLLSEPLALPLDLSLLQRGAVPADPTVVTSNRVNQIRLTIPSLWWAEEQFGGSLLVDWLAYPGTDGTPKRVDLAVNSQVWSIYNYVERYTFVNHLGTSAADYGYNSRIFDTQGELLAAYICEFGAGAPEVGAAVIERCTVFLASDARTSLTGRPKTGAKPATPADTAPAWR